MSPFELALNAFVALAGLIFAVALLVRENRERIHVLAALFVGAISAGSLFRSLNWVYQVPVFSWLGFFFFSIFPLLGLLFFENLTRRVIPVAAKVFMLVITFAFILGLVLFDHIDKIKGCLFVLSIWHLTAILYAAYSSYRAARDPKTPARLKAVLWSLLIALGVCVVLASEDWLHVFGVATLRLGPVALLVFIHILYRVFNAHGDFSLRREAAHSVSVVFGILFFAAIVGNLSIPTTGVGVFQLSLIAFICQMPMTFMEHYWLRIRRVGDDSLLERLNRLPHTDLRVFIQSLNTLDEIVNAIWLSSLETKNIGCTFQPHDIEFFQKSPFISLSKTEFSLRHRTLSAEERTRLEQIRHLMLAGNVHALCFLDRRRGFLGLSFTSFMDQSHYHELALLLGSFSRLLPEVFHSGGEEIAS